MATPLRTVDANELAATTMESFVPSARKSSVIKGRKSSVDARPTTAGKPPRRVSFKTTDATGDEFKRSQKMGGTLTFRVYARARERFEREWGRGKTEEKDVCDKMRAIRVEYE
jgi:hypothetical protein